MCQCTLFDVGGVEIHSIECIEYCTKDQSNVEDVEDRSNTPKGCNAMYVGDVEDGKRTYTHILAHNFLNTSLILKFYVCQSMSKMSKIDQIHIRAVMLCMSKMSKILKQAITGVY